MIEGGFLGGGHSVSDDAGHDEVEELESAGGDVERAVEETAYEETAYQEDVNSDTFPETRDSNQQEEAQGEPSSSTTVTKKVKVPRILPYEIETDGDGIEWFSQAGKRQSKFETFIENADFTISSC